ncbi:MAG: TIGR03936 family radical SAM-associated protein [Candidatus Omnitrophota bacterium]
MKAKLIIEINFSKKGLMRYISHLDLLRLFRRASLRANLPLENTRGFNPHPKISVDKAVKLGLERDDLKCKFAIKNRVEPDEFARSLQLQLPQGIIIREAKLLGDV